MSDLFEQQPEAEVVPPPDTSKYLQKNAVAKRKFGKRLIIVIVVGGVLAALTSGVGAIVGLILAVIFFGPTVNRNRKIKELERGHAVRVEAAEERHRGALQQWERAKQNELRAKALAEGATAAWFPVASPPEVDRVDVFGGAAHGWPHLLSHLESFVVTDGRPTTLLDFSQRDVAAPLIDLLVEEEEPLVGLQFPRDLDKFNLLAEFSADEVTEVVTESIRSLHQNPDPALLAQDRRILKALIKALDGPVSARKLLAGVRVLLRTATADEGVLDAAEITVLIGAIDHLDANSEAMRSSLFFLQEALEMVVGDADTDAAVPLSIYPDEGLVVIATDDPSRMRKDFFDRIVFQSALQRLKAGNAAGGDRILVIAGADAISTEALEELDRVAFQRGVKLVLLFEHLRGEGLNLIGAGQSATVIMRLGNANEANAAAEYIGRGYKFALSSLSVQIGITNTNGGGTSKGHTDTRTEGNSTTTGSSYTKGNSRTSSHPYDSSSTSSSTTNNSGSTQSYSTAIAQSSQEMENWSRADSKNDTETKQRVYEFTLEPAVIQTLPPTSFFLVSGAGDGRTGRLPLQYGDCNPAIGRQKGVTDVPRALYTYPAPELQA